MKKSKNKSHLFAPGHAKVGGRAKGQPNRTTQLIKDAIVRASELAGEDLANGQELGDDGGTINYLRWLAHEEPAAFAGLLGKVLPIQLQSDKPIGITHIERVIVTVEQLKDRAEAAKLIDATRLRTAS